MMWTRNNLMALGVALIIGLGGTWSVAAEKQTQEVKKTQLSGHGSSPLPIGEATEQQLPEGETNQLRQDPKLFQDNNKPIYETKKVEKKNVTTKKLQNVVPPILFKSGKADIPEDYVEKLRKVLNDMRARVNVRLHFIGHTDNIKLRGRAKKKYGDNVELSKERAGITAEFFIKALSLPPESVSYEGFGASKPVASNRTAAGRTKNRRVEVEVWYDEVKTEMVDEKVEIARTRRILVCRMETVCKLSYKKGHSRRTKLKNLIPPFHYDFGELQPSAEFMRQLKQALYNLRQKENVQLRFIAHADNTPLMGREARIYGDHMGLSKALARRFAVMVQEKLGLAANAVSSDGKGGSRPIASNNSPKGRALNRRIDVEFWHDDPLQELPNEPQICPEAAAAETVERVYNPPEGDIAPILFEKGKPIIPAGLAPRLKRAMEDIKDKGNVRLKFIGYTSNKRLDRRTAQVYGDDIGLSTARARRAKQAVQTLMQLKDEQVVHEGRGFVQSHDVVNTGFVDIDQSKVEIQIVYDDLAMLDDYEGVKITRINRKVVPQNPFELNLMRISVDGQPLNDPNKSIRDVQRCTDVALDKVLVDFKFDPGVVKPRLNVSAWPQVVERIDDAATEFPENQVNFLSYTNYPHYIHHAEVRLFKANQSTRDKPLSVIKLDKDGKGFWQFKGKVTQAPRVEFKYVLRVYDKKGRFDETQAQTIWVVDKRERKIEKSDGEKRLMAVYGENRLSLQNIPLKDSTGTIKVYGKKVPEEKFIWFGGYALPIGEQEREFTGELIIPHGLHTVELSVTDKNGNGHVYYRDLALESNWFTVGMFNITAGINQTNGPAALVTQDDSHYDNDLSLDGHIAFYTKGRFKNQWKLTASADTREGPIHELFSNFLSRSPDSVLRRLDPDQHYPTLGDDSSTEDDAPTSGKFYFKLEKQENYGLWGDFKIAYTDTYLAHVDRQLYGANLNAESQSTTGFGEKRFKTNLFAAEPGTVAGRDEFRGTSGSLYFLRHQDIGPGTDRLRIEWRDTVSGQVVAVKNLVTALDYDIDYIQGRVMLSEPLSASAPNNMLINSGDSGGNQVFLVARYEYTPGFDDINDIATGGRVHYWFGDRFKLGATVNQSNTANADNSLNGVDLTLRMTAGTWLKVEQTQSQGPVSNSELSNDGGYGFNTASLAGSTDVSASGQRVEGNVRLDDLFKIVKGTTNFYYQSLDAGYSAPGLIAPTAMEQYGARARIPVGPFGFRFKMDNKYIEQGLETESYEVDVDFSLNRRWSFSAGARFDDRLDKSPVVPATQVQGDRTDVALRADYNSGKTWSLYSYMQKSVKLKGPRDDNSRIGIGGSKRTSDRFKIHGEASYGELGEGAKLGTEYKLSDRTNLYLNYSLENERTDSGVLTRKGNMASGFKTRYSDAASVYMEERYTHGDLPVGLTHAMGFDLAFKEYWNFGGSLDLGNLRDHNTGAKTQRQAMGLNLGYKKDAFSFASALEYRIDVTETGGGAETERTTWLTKNGMKYKYNPSWTLIGKFNHSESESSAGAFYNGNFTEAVLGGAYRPVYSDRLNALFKYTYFYNLPTQGQNTILNTAAEYIQKSHITAADFIFDVSKRFSLGGKFAYRFGELSQDRVNPQFFDNQASLYIARVDWKFTQKWDWLVEARMLQVVDADQRSGFLTGLNRKLTQHIKLGIGYNFTDFSDDLTDLDFDNQGVYINLLGKF